MTGTVEAVHSNFEAIEADWLRYYGRTLSADLYGPTPLGFRRIVGLLTWLPAEAALWRSMKVSWTEDRELAAIQIELLDSLRRTYIAANSKKGARMPDPIRIPRPWDSPREASSRRGTSLKELIRDTKLPVRSVPRGGE